MAIMLYGECDDDDDDDGLQQHRFEIGRVYSYHNPVSSTRSPASPRNLPVTVTIMSLMSAIL
jgi:hypothetical protein